jgi:Erv1 / Alr family
MPIRKALGNDIWVFLHSMTIIAKEKQLIDNYKLLEEASIYLLPCPKCREHFNAYLSKPEYNIDDIVDKLYSLHNQVNSLLNYEIQDKTVLDKYKDIGLLPILSRIILTYSEYWNRTRWKTKLELNKTKYLYTMMYQTGIILNINLNLTEWWNDVNAFEYENVYQMLKDNNLTFDLRTNFYHDTQGCECINK